jgi:hypothetical protein
MLPFLNFRSFVREAPQLRAVGDIFRQSGVPVHLDEDLVGQNEGDLKPVKEKKVIDLRWLPTTPIKPPAPQAR